MRSSRLAEAARARRAEHEAAVRPRPLLLGEMPSKRGDEFYMFPLSGSPATRLLKWAGIEKPRGEAAYWTLIEHFETMNAQERYTARFDLAAARRRWTEYLLCEVPVGVPQTVVCLGRNAQGTIGTIRPGYFEWEEVGSLRYVSTPHPSGRNRYWNDENNVERMGLVLREALALAAEPFRPGVELIADGRVIGGPLR